MTIGERIKAKRIECGFSVEELADRLGKNRATVYRYENGDIENLPTTVLEPIAKALGTTPAYLMGYDNNLEHDTDFIAKMMKDSELVSHINILLSLDSIERKTIYDMIDFYAQKKGL